MALKCDARAEGGGVSVFAAELLEDVGASYGHVASGSERAPRLRGARLRLRPRADLSAEVLQRRLECHEALAVLGRLPVVADDPYVLPGEWLDIAAESTGDGFVVDVRIDDYAKAQRVLDRARRFAAGRSREDP